MKLNSVRMRLALWNVGVLALVLAIFGAALRYTNQVRLTATVDQELAAMAEWYYGGPRRGRMGGPFRGGPRRPPPPAFSPSADRDGRVAWERGGRWGRSERGWGGSGRRGGPLPMARDGLRLRRFALSGRSLSPDGEGPWDRAALLRAVRGTRVYSSAWADDEPVRVLSVALRRNGQIVQVAQFALPLTGVYEELDRFTRTQLTLIPLALLAAALGGAFLTERALRPVRRITQAAAQIGASDLSARLPVKGQDEFSELACTFNGMLARLEQAFTRLAHSLEQQRRFTADASHELRTPLTIIKANTSLALEEERPPADYRRALEAADRAVDTTTRIVQDLLLLARGDAGQLRLDMRPVRMGDLLELAAEAFRTSPSPSVTVELSHPSLGVMGDAHHLLRLFTNLLENAVRHTPPSGRITVSAAAAEEAVVVRVRDTGEGIPPQHLPHVCERFYRVDTARTREVGGTGLGLAICQSIVTAHNGSLQIESVVGKGTTVTIRLPA